MTARPRRSLAGLVVALGAAALPGLLAGIHLSGLLFFLNPRLPFGLGILGRGLLVYTPALVAASLLLHLPWLFSPRLTRVVPWTVSGVLAVVAGLDAFHASHFAYYLPSGINVRLIKAGFLLGVAALIVFYTALLHALHRRPFGRRSRIGIWLLAFASLYVTVERREAWNPRPQAAPLPSSAERLPRLRLWVVGFDSATLDALLPLAEQGDLPVLSRLLRQGSYARLRSLVPPRRQPLWTTLATGKYPYKHGVVSSKVFPAPFLAPGAELDLLPVGFSFWHRPALGRRGRPTSRSDRRALALWEILPELGYASGVVGWPLVAPAPDGVRFAVSDRYLGTEPPPGEIWPAELRAGVGDRADADLELSSELLEALGPVPPAKVLEGVREDQWAESLALDLGRRFPETDAVFLRFPGLARASRAYFGGLSAYQLEQRHQDRFEQASDRLTAYYRFLDRLLGRLLEGLRPPDLLVVVSAHGVAPPSRWRRVWGDLSRQRAVEGNLDGDADGVVLLYGEGVRSGAFLERTALVDLVPTLLYGLGVPVGRDLDGRVLTGAFRPELLERQPMTFVPSYETLAPRSGATSPGRATSTPLGDG